jgi:hypothetical protein
VITEASTELYFGLAKSDEAHTHRGKGQLQEATFHVEQSYPWNVARVSASSAPEPERAAGLTFLSAIDELMFQRINLFPRNQGKGNENTVAAIVSIERLPLKFELARHPPCDSMAKNANSLEIVVVLKRITLLQQSRGSTCLPSSSSSAAFI